MTKNRPWIKVVNKKGTCLVRCKDPGKAAIYFVRLTSSDGQLQFPGAMADKLFINDVEYNPPMREHRISAGLHPLQWDVSKESLGAARRDLEYLIKMHQAFYE